MKIILIMGLPGSGKTTLASRLKSLKQKIVTFTFGIVSTGSLLAKRLNSAQSFRCRPQSARAATCAPRLLETSTGATGGKNGSDGCESSGND